MLFEFMGPIKKTENPDGVVNCVAPEKDPLPGPNLMFDLEHYMHPILEMVSTSVCVHL